ncbi:tetratricopeptide repeat protein [Zunongwangia sp. F363]|uniref:histidine kinase n=1 Tax=Autumnicola tepida TaxID=3075595 RepID=A0ABU3CEG4_9FLAO|nr:tetratricopeptide repeat protein [Zunongwangia sp. F363]MDT0644696.1 tetratricopeptide repeat protein [Zunongwangia sp. F363]
MYRIALFIIFLWSSILSASARESTVSDSINLYLDQAQGVMYNNVSAALLFLEKAEALAENSGEDLRAKVAHNFAVAYYIKGDYDASLEFYLKTLQLYRVTNNKIGIAKCLIGQGLIQQGIDRHREAISFFEQAIKAYKKAGASEDANPAFLNIAISQIEEGKLNAAEENLHKAIALSKKAGRRDVEHLSLNKLGQVAFLRGNLDKAVSYYYQVLENGEEPNNWEKSFAYAGLAEAYLKQDKIIAARENALKAVDYANGVESLWDLERNTLILAEVYAAGGEMAKAYKELKLNKKYKDSLYNQQKLREINLLQLESRESENERLQAENDLVEQKLFINSSITIALAIAVVFLVLLFVLFRKNARQKAQFTRALKSRNKTILEKNELISRRNKELDVSNSAKDRLFSILSHDLRSPLASIQQLLELIKAGGVSQEEQKALLDEMLIQVNGTSAMLQNLLHWANSQLDGNKVKPEEVVLPEKVKKIQTAYFLAAKNKDIDIVHEEPVDAPVVWADRGHLSVIIHNILSNAIKFTRKGRKIKIFYREAGERIFLHIFDGGEGISEEKIEEIKGFASRMLSQVGTDMELGTGIGLLLVKQFLELNNGQLEINTFPGKGSEFIVSFPKAAVKDN